MANEGALQGPVIPLLINNTVDPQALNGRPLDTYAKYDNPVIGDLLYPRWLGLAQDGNPVDVTDIEFIVDPINETEFGFAMPISNFHVLSLDKGQAFYSYYLKRITDAPDKPKVESKRIHFGIGKAGLLPAPQVKESHDHQLDIDGVPGTTITVAVAPYTAMANGDKVQLVWKGVREDGTDGRTVTIPVKTLSDQDTDPVKNPGRVLSWILNASHANEVRRGSFRLHYEITYASSGVKRDTVSAQRCITVNPPILPLLSAPSVKDLVGTEINPGQFPEGIRIVIPIYPNIRVGDDVLAYGERPNWSSPVKNKIGHLKVDASNIESGKLEVPLAADWLSVNRGACVNVLYQYARPDAAGTSMPLELTVREPMVLPTPTVDNSVVIKGRDELDPMLAYNGAYIVIPANATIGEGDSVTAHFKGFGASGSCDINNASQSNPTKFKVPASALPSNFGKTVEVTYSVAGQMAVPSLCLYIRTLNIFSSITCDGLQLGSPATLKFSEIPANGALLRIERWPFISTEQTVRLWLTSSGIDDLDIIPLRQVSGPECDTGVTDYLTRADLEGIANNGTFTLRASVSFDGGNTTTVLSNPLRIKLLR